MKVTVKFFALFRKTAGTDRLLIELHDGARIAGLIQALREELDNPSFAGEPTIFLVNQQTATPETILKDGDEVMMLHHIGGGTEDESQ